jgi:molybdenum cofactor guanylyltransferase
MPYDPISAREWVGYFRVPCPLDLLRACITWAIGRISLNHAAYGPKPMDDFSVFVLAGGKSSRMGTDKALLAIEGTTLLARALGVARQISGSVFIVGEKLKFAGFGDVLEDRFLDCGPLAGIQAALKSSATELNLMLAVDLPFLTEALLRFLLSISQQSDAIVTVPRMGGRLHPLCAVYRPAFSVMAEESLRNRGYKIDRLFERVSTRIVDEPELNAAGFTAAAFENVNTPVEWSEAKRRLSRRVS